MRFSQGDGQVFEGEARELGDVLWIEEDAFLVFSVEGEEATIVPHPAAKLMKEAAETSLSDAMHIHRQVMARGYLAAYAAGLVGGDLEPGLHLFSIEDEEWVIGRDAQDAEALFRQEHGLAAEVPFEYQIEQVPDDQEFGLTLEPIGKSAADWAGLYGRGWFCGNF